jgi:hypothetical protein
MGATKAPMIRRSYLCTQYAKYDQYKRLLPVQIVGVPTIADQPATPGERVVRHHGGEPMLCGQIGDLILAPVVEQRVDKNKQRVGASRQTRLRGRGRQS